MAENVFKGRIQIDPGNTKQMFEGVASAAAKTGQAFSTLQKQVSSFGGGVKTFTNNFKSFGDQFKRLPPEADKAAAALTKLKNASNASNNVLINTGRIFQDLPFGIIGIANNINPLIESFQRLSAQSKETGTSLGKNLLGALAGGGGFGLAFSLITGAAAFAVNGLSAFTRGLGSSKDGADEASESFTRTAEALDAISEGAKRAESQLQFLNKLGAINVKIFGFGDLEDLRQQSQAQQQLSSELRDKQAAIFKSSLDLFNKSNDELGITQEEREKLGEKHATALKEIDEKINKSSQDQRILYRQIQLQKNEDAKDANEKSKAAFDKYVSDTIARAKQIEEAFGDILKTPKLDEDLFTNKEQVFRNAQRTINDFSKRLLPLKVKVVLDKIEANVQTPEFSKEVTDSFEKAQSRLKGLKPFDISSLFTGFKTSSDNLKTLVSDLENAAQIVSSVLAPAFQGMFDAIVQGGSAMKGFFEGLKNSITQLISKLIQAAILAALLSAIPGGGNFGAIFGKLIGFGGGRASGGPVNKRVSYLVGEAGPEIFTPDTGGRIIPNNQLGGAGVSATGGATHRVVFEIAGQKLRGVLSLTDQSLRRIT